MTRIPDDQIVSTTNRRLLRLSAAAGLALLVSGIGIGQEKAQPDQAAAKAPEKKAAAQKPAAKQATAKQATAKQATAKQATAKQATAKQATAKKPAVKTTIQKAGKKAEQKAEKAKTPEETEAENARMIESISGALRSAGVHGYDVEIFFEAGVAKLQGAIADAGRKAVATKVASEVTGVDSVDNQLKIQPRKIPYRVLVSLAVATDPLVTRRSIARLRADVATVLERTIGETWTTRVEINDWLFPTSVSGLDRLTAESLLSRYRGTDWDRVMLVTLTRTGARFDLAGRPFNAASRGLALSRRRVEHDRRGLATQVGRLVRDMFGATVDITVGGAKEVEVEVRAGEFPVADPDSAQLAPGDLLEPFLRYRNRKTRVVERTQPLTWTYLKVLDVKRATVRCEVATALRNPLQGSSRGVELMASGIDSVLPSTHLILLPRGNISRPLIGHRVVVLPRRLTKKAASTAAPDEGVREGSEKEKKRAELSKPRRLLSDRAGRVEIVVDKKMPLVWMYVMSGSSVLARVPFVPGREIESELMLPDDAPRLGVEGHVTRLEGALIETVARRAVHMALATRSAEAEPPDWTKVDTHLKAIAELPTYRTFEVQIDGFEFSAVQAAQAGGNRVAVNRIRTLCKDARTLLAKHLDEAKIREFRAKIDDIRKTTPAAAAPTPAKAKAATGN